MDYQSALDYLYGLTDYGKERIARYDPDTLNLSRMRRVLVRLGNPHKRFPSVHIAGTKGKGSVAAACASILQVAGFRTGLYTSPHLHTFRERIRVSGDLIAAGTFTALLSECRPVFDSEPELTTFEAITALAFVHFVKARIEFAVLEVGLGGRLDATNVVTPEVAVITSLSYDHVYLLGETLAEIAGEKAGIVKPGVPTVSAPQQPEALAVLQAVCTARGSPFTLIGRDWIPHRDKADPCPSLEGQRFELEDKREDSAFEGDYVFSLLGRHQLNNAAVAVAVMDNLRRGGLSLEPDHIRQGLAKVEWPGRFEVLARDPVLVVDCAHNADSAAKLVTALEDCFPRRRWSFVLGASVDKDLPGILQALIPMAEQIIVTQARHPRAMSAQRVADTVRKILAEMKAVRVDVQVTEDVASAMAVTVCVDVAGYDAPFSPPSRGRNLPTCVTGSIFVVAEVREFWARATGRPLLEADDPTAIGLRRQDHNPAAEMSALAD